MGGVTTTRQLITLATVARSGGVQGHRAYMRQRRKAIWTFADSVVATLAFRRLIDISNSGYATISQRGLEELDRLMFAIWPEMAEVMQKMSEPDKSENNACNCVELL